MKIRKPSRILAFAGRTIVRVGINGKQQAFYRSTGQNSSMPGEWFPFDGLRYPDCWFDKTAYAATGTPLHRYGTQELYEASQILKKRLQSYNGTELSAEAVNGYLCRQGHYLEMAKAGQYWRLFRQARIGRR